MQNQLLFITSVSNHTIQEKIEIIEKNIREKNDLIFQVIREIINTFHMEPHTTILSCQSTNNSIQRQKCGLNEPEFDDFVYDFSPKRCVVTGNIIPEPLYDDDGFPLSMRGLPEYDEYDEIRQIRNMARYLSMNHSIYYPRQTHIDDYENSNKNGFVNVM